MTYVLPSYTLPEPDAWRALSIGQDVFWPDGPALARVRAQLGSLPELVSFHQCSQLKSKLAAVAAGEAFLLQAGDCAETFDQTSEASIHRKLSLLSQMALVLRYGLSLPVVTVGRIAGQYAKPRSMATEARGSSTLPAYRGDAVNGFDFSPMAREPDPHRLIMMYQRSEATLAILRRFAQHPDNPDEVLQRLRSLIRHPAGNHHAPLVTQIDRAVRFVHASGIGSLQVARETVYTSHEGLLLDYEQALTRTDPATGRSYCASAHLLWIGDRTRNLDGAHVAFFSGLANPIAVKLGPDATPELVLALIAKLNPSNEEGRLSFILRMGADAIRDVLPDIVDRVTTSGARVAWICDPMHGNTFVSPTGHKTRHFDAIVAEVEGFFEVHRALRTVAGGLHLEVSGDDVTECVGGSDGIAFNDLLDRYESRCDPRLNRSQSLDLSLLVAELGALQKHSVSSRTIGSRSYLKGDTRS